MSHGSSASSSLVVQSQGEEILLDKRLQILNHVSIQVHRERVVGNSSKLVARVVENSSKKAAEK